MLISVTLGFFILPRALPHWHHRRQSRQHFSNPSTLDTIPHALSTAVPKIGAHAKGKELFDNLSLRAYCRWGTCSAMTGVLHGEMKRGGSGFVSRGRVTACSEKTSHGGSASRPDGAMQWSSAVLVLRMNVGAFVEQATDCRHLFFGIPRGAADETVRGVVQRAASAVVRRRVRVGTRHQQKSNNLNTITGRGQMQRSISDVDPMKDL